jgi:hypothetical protein
MDSGWSQMLKGKSDPSLKRYYRLMNSKFFEGTLPDNVLVRWARPGEESDCASTERRPQDPNQYVILLNRKKCASASIKLVHLLHEMVHVATHNRDDHGSDFSAWHRLLTQRGAFEKGAVLKDITLF